jgi:hypothetical protein
MKKLFLSLFTFCMMLGAHGIVNAQCNVDPNACPTSNDDPACNTPDAMACADSGTSYEDTLKFVVHDEANTDFQGQPVTAEVDSIVIDSVGGIPAGLTFETKSGNQNDPEGRFSPYDGHGPAGCARLFGTPTESTTSDDSVTIFVTFYGTAFGQQSTIDTTIKVGFDCGTTSSRAGNQLAQQGYRLEMAPNPANQAANLTLQLREPANVQVQVLDVQGREVFRQASERLQSGERQIDLPVNQWNKGIYIVRTRIGEQIDTRKLMVR